MNVLATDKAWAAGIVDADGCIFIRKTYQTWKGKRTTYFSLAVTVSQVGDEVPTVIKKLQDTWGGCVTGKSVDKRKDYSRQPVGRWQVSTLAAERFLRDIQPYAVGKKNQIDLAIESRENSLAVNRWDTKMKTIQESYFTKLKTLKRPAISAVA